MPPGLWNGLYLVSSSFPDNPWLNWNEVIYATGLNILSFSGNASGLVFKEKTKLDVAVSKCDPGTQEDEAGEPPEECASTLAPTVVVSSRAA